MVAYCIHTAQSYCKLYENERVDQNTLGRCLEKHVETLLVGRCTVNDVKNQSRGWDS